LCCVAWMKNETLSLLLASPPIPQQKESESTVCTLSFVVTGVCLLLFLSLFDWFTFFPKANLGLLLLRQHEGATVGSCVTVLILRAPLKYYVMTSRNSWIPCIPDSTNDYSFGQWTIVSFDVVPLLLILFSFKNCLFWNSRSV
jgi:hypothetical protein